MRPRITEYCLVLVLILIWGTFVFGSERATYDASGTSYNRESSLKRLFELINNEGKEPIGSLESNITFFSYLDKTELDTSLCKDVSSYGTLKPNIEMDKYKDICHIPSKSVSLSYYDFEKSSTKEDSIDAGKKFFFPRVKSYRKDLPIITTEPYQRLMTFAIEVCMVPSMWYLELIHCMFVSTIPYLNGMLMSYSLQDIVGSAIMSMEYRNEKFNLNNCMESVSYVKDDAISSNMADICHNMKKCLDSEEFTLGDFSELEQEFSYRIKNVYASVPNFGKLLKPTLFARYSILYSIHLLFSKFKLNKEYPEINFLVIRIMTASLSYYALAKELNLLLESESKVVDFFTKMFTSLMFKDTATIINSCKKSVADFGNKRLDAKILDIFCKEIFSVGFINEDIGIHKYRVEGYLVNPKRVLLESYVSVIPEMMQNLNIEKYDCAWMYFGNLDGSLKAETKFGEDVSKQVEGSEYGLDSQGGTTTGKKKKKKSFFRTVGKFFSRITRRKESINRPKVDDFSELVESNESVVSTEQPNTEPVQEGGVNDNKKMN
ncbi:hypothetical protein FG379_000505 [Cryptosporidium bovis]|uniref:uncharacterized protein n=1 Tax=Cryptosporidium bovis TaxID=310047 RepID=UPI00351A14CD|nr:hypothetical protein FG379_000505 [Cryptosporidium bovis]